MIACKNVTKRFDRLVAVNDVTFQVQNGICALVGPNGAGKSTLLRKRSELGSGPAEDLAAFQNFAQDMHSGSLRK